MSFRNGDKSRHGRLRKAKLARRARMEALKAELAKKSPAGSDSGSAGSSPGTVVDAG